MRNASPLVRLAAIAACLAAAPLHAAVLSVDINDRTMSPTDTQAGFNALTMDSGGGTISDTFNGVTIDIDAFGTAIDDRHRNGPTDSGDLTQSAIYRDFVFAAASNSAGAAGIDTTISGLDQDRWYWATVWSFDDDSNSTRVSDWTTIGGNGTQLVADDYSFTGATLPTANADDRFSFWVKSDNTGAFKLEGRNVTTSTTSPAVFLNAIELVTFPEMYFIDIDSTRLGSTNTTGNLFTESGWTSLNATFHSEPGSPASVTVDGIEFEIFSTPGNQSRVRQSGATPLPNALTADFVYDEGTGTGLDGNALGLKFGEAGDLTAGIWEVEIWSWDASIGDLGDIIVGVRENGVETIITTTATADPDDPIVKFRFVSDGVSAYDVFVRESNSTNNRTRLNAVRLVLLPTPAALPAGLAMLGLAAVRRRRR